MSKRSLTAELRHLTYDGNQLKDLKYKLDGAFAKKCQAQNLITSLRSQLSSLRSVVESHCHSLPEETEHLTTDLNVRSAPFSLSLYRKPEM